MLHVMLLFSNTLMDNRMFRFLLLMHVNLIYDGFYFEGVTTWYQSVPGLNTLGTWEVISITMGSSRLIET